MTSVKAKTDTDNKIMSRIETAVKKRDSKLLGKILELKPDLSGNDGARLLCNSLDNVEIATMLVQAGAKVNMSQTAEYKRDRDKYAFLHRLAPLVDVDERYLKLAILIMDRGADVNATDGDGDTALHLAVNHGSVAYAKELLERGADVEAENDNNLNAIHIAINGILSGVTKTDVMLPLLIKSGNANEEIIKRRGLMAFKHSLFEFTNLTEPMKVLFDLGIPHDIMDDYCEDYHNSFLWPGHWCMPLNYAAHFEHLGTVDFLVSRGADINKQSKCGKPPIAIGFLQDNILTIRKLIELGGDIHMCSKNDGQYPIHIACDLRSPHSIRLLLHLGADITVTDKNGKTPLALLTRDKQLDSPYKIVIQHLVTLLSKGLVINENDLAIIEKRTKPNEYYKKCLAEIEKMKNTLLYSDVTFFNIFVKSIEQLTRLVKNADFLNGYGESKSLFHIYFEQLENNVTLAKQIREMLDTQKNVLDEAVHKVLPEIALVKIIGYSTVEDIKNLKQNFYFSIYESDAYNGC